MLLVAALRNTKYESGMAYVTISTASSAKIT